MYTENTLILKSGRGDFEKFYLNEMSARKIPGIDVDSYYVDVPLLLEYFIIIYIQKLQMPKPEILYGNWKKNIGKYKNVILFDRNYNWNVIDFIKKENPECRIIIWYWNPINGNRIPEKYRGFCEEWSFDEADCKKYNFHYNTQFSFKNLFYNKKFSNTLKYDVYFVGNDKGRAERIFSFQLKLEKVGGKCKFIVLKDKTSQKKYPYRKRSIKYETNISFLLQTKSVLEIVQNNQSGLTVRCIEALFSNKKIITNNKNIISYDIYDPDKVFILEDLCDMKKLLKFIKSESKDYPEKLIQKYDFESWIKKFKL